MVQGKNPWMVVTWEKQRLSYLNGSSSQRTKKWTLCLSQHFAMPLTTKVGLIVGLFNLGKFFVDKECLSKGSKVASKPIIPFVESKISQPKQKDCQSLDNYYSKLLVTCNLTLRSVSSLNNPQNY
jgi:hypothetical protein